MKIKHYRAPDMRHALRQVREAQGPDAVILSSRRVNGGVEVVAAVDYDEQASFEQGYGAPPHDAARPHSSMRPDMRLADGLDPHERSTSYGAADAGGARFGTSAPSPGPHYEVGQGGDESAMRAARVIRESMTRGERYGAPAGRASESRGAEHDSLRRGVEPAASDADLNEELRMLRRMLETQLATLAWNDLSRRAPIQTELLKELTTWGLAQDLAGELAAHLPPRQEFAEAHRWALAMLARRVQTSEERWLNVGGMVAMIGPTGVGKTTLIAKLAARWVLRHGPRDLALVSADAVRIGAQEQIHTLARLLGAPAYAVDGAGELPSLLEQLSERRLVLIDTAGLSQRDPHLPDELSLLASAHKRLETALVVSAASQAGAIEESFEKFACARPASCVLTKLDEAASLGGAISALIRFGAPLMYVSDGQRVPEDLSPARAHQLIARAVELSRKSGASPDEDLLRRRFGPVAHALA